MLRRLLLAPLLLTFAAVASAATSPGDHFGKVDVAPTRTSIYIGIVSMTMPTFVRAGSTYTAPYTAKVFPFAFYNEKGTLKVEIGDAQLDDLAHGKTIELTGRAVNDDGEERKVTGKATPKDATSGALKVRVTVSKHIELIFNTTYRFP